MGVEDNKKTVQLVEEAWNRSDVGALDQYFSAKFDNSKSLPPGLPLGIETAKMMHQMVMQSFPDRKAEIQELIADGDKVMVRNHITGTNKGGVTWLGAPANDAKIDFDSISIYEFDKKGQIAGHYGLNDAYMLGIQVGVFAPPQMG
jgi:predicted ester cyclase